MPFNFTVTVPLLNSSSRAQATQKWIDPDTYAHICNKTKHKGANKGNQSRELNVVLTGCPRTVSYNPWMVCLLPWQPPLSDLITLKNSIRYHSKYKHYSLHPSSSGQSTVLIYSLLLFPLIFLVVPRRFPFHSCALTPHCAESFVCACETVCDIHYDECPSTWEWMTQWTVKSTVL